MPPNGQGYKATEKLRRLRIRRGLKLVDVAEQIGVSKSLVSKMEVGDRRVSPHVALRLMSLFGLTLDEAVEKRVLKEDLGLPPTQMASSRR